MTIFKKTITWIFAIISFPIIYLLGRLMIFILVSIQHFLRNGDFHVFEETFNLFIFAPIFISYFCVIGPVSIVPNNKKTFAVIICLIFIFSCIYSFLTPYTDDQYFWLNVSNSIEFIGAVFATWKILKNNRSID